MTKATITSPGRKPGSFSKGQNEFLVGDVPIFVANQGDVVYAPAQVWHRPRHVGNGMATRLAIVGYANSHVYSAEGAAE